MFRAGLSMRFVIVLICLFSVPGAFANAPKVLDVIAVEYPPYTGASLPDGGQAFRMLRELIASKNLPIIINPRFLPPARAQHAVDTTDWCIALYPPSPGTSFVFHRIGETSLFLRLVRQKSEDAFSWDAPTYFAGKKIALLRTKSMADYWQPYKEAGAEFVFVETLEQAMNMVVRGRVNYAVANDIILEQFNSALPDNQKLQLSETTVQEFPSGVYLSARCRDLLDSTN
jgi:polar amino acid transport system substrate-binding protein